MGHFGWKVESLLAYSQECRTRLNLMCLIFNKIFEKPHVYDESIK